MGVIYVSQLPAWRFDYEAIKEVLDQLFNLILDTHLGGVPRSRARQQNIFRKSRSDYQIMNDNSSIQITNAFKLLFFVESKIEIRLFYFP